MLSAGLVYNIFVMANTVETPKQEAVQDKAQDFRPWVIYLFALGVSFVFMFFFGLDSPIHTFNTHCDYQWFTTMGRGILAGKVPYRDLFEQKGPIIFFVFAFANLFPHPQFVVWCIEVLCLSLFLYFCYKIARKFLSPWLSLLVLPIMMMVLSANYARGLEGACVEEYCFPIFAYGLWCFLDFLFDRKSVTWQRSLALGICIGIIFWTKYSMLEFFIVPFLIWLIVNLIERKFLALVRSGLMMLGGLAIITLPIFIYFAVHGALDDLWRVYFMINIGGYNGDIQVGNTIKSDTPGENFVHSLFIGGYFIIFMLWGLICFVIHNWRKSSSWLLLVAIVVTWGMIGFFCGYFYYYLPMFTYAVLGVIYLIKVVTYMLHAIDLKIKRRGIKIAWVAAVVVASWIAALPFVPNLSEINCPRGKYAQCVVADIIAEYNQTATEPATLFCYRMADCGFYNAAGIIPNVYYYAENSFTKEKFPEMFQALDKTISDQTCDFVVTYRNIYEQNCDFINAYYHPYFDNDLERSTFEFTFYEPGDYGHTSIVLLYRN